MPRDRPFGAMSRAHKSYLRARMASFAAIRAKKALAIKTEPELEIIDLENENRTDECLEIAESLGLSVNFCILVKISYPSYISCQKN